MPVPVPSGFVAVMAGAHGTFVAFVQPRCDPDVACHIAGAIHSSDGVSWQQAAAASGTFTNSRVSAVVPFGTGFAAAGSSTDTGGVAGRIWLSPDGTSWEAVDTRFDLGREFLICEGLGVISGGVRWLASVEGRLLAVGNSLTGDRPCRPEETSLGWTSTDGRVWEPSEIPRQARIEAVGGGHGQFLFSIGTHRDSRVWRSGDGVAWESASIEVPAQVGIDHLLWFDGRYLALGSGLAEGEISELVWESADGATWTLVQQWQLGRNTGGFDEAIALSDRVVAAGYVTSQFGRGRAGVQQTTDGVTWSDPETAPFEDDFLTALASNDTSLLLAGRGEAGGGARLWVEQLE